MTSKRASVSVRPVLPGRLAACEGSAAVDGDVLLLLHALDHAIDELVDLLGRHLLQTLLPIFIEQVAGFERLADASRRF